MCTRACLWLATVSTGRQLYAVRGHGSEVMSMAVDPTGMVLATAGNDCVTKWWSVESRTQLDHQTVRGLGWRRLRRRRVCVCATCASCADLC